MSKRRSKGEGTIYQRLDSLWVAQITLPNGKRKTKYAKTQKEVKEWLLALRNQLREGFVAEKDIRLNSFLDLYFKDVASHNLRDKTLQSYRYIIENHIKPELGYYKLTQITPPIIQKFYSQKLQTLSGRTVQYIHSILHKSFNQAERWYLVPRNVFDLVDPPKREHKELNVWNSTQVKHFLKTCEGNKFYPLFALAIATGMRESEILGLYWEDIDFINSKIKIQRSVQYIIGKGMIITDLKSRSSQRSVNVAKFAMDALRTQFDNSENKTGLVFITRKNTPISPRHIVRHFKALIKKANLPDIRFHDLRHTAATLMLLAGIHPKVVQEMLGHSNISITLGIYSHVLPSMQKEASQRIDELLRI